LQVAAGAEYEDALDDAEVALKIEPFCTRADNLVFVRKSANGFKTENGVTSSEESDRSLPPSPPPKTHEDHKRGLA
jgi:hypothetical protein